VPSENDALPFHGGQPHDVWLLLCDASQLVRDARPLFHGVRGFCWPGRSFFFSVANCRRISATFPSVY
jgi:hypothetical protein